MIKSLLKKSRKILLAFCFGLLPFSVFSQTFAEVMEVNSVHQSNGEKRELRDVALELKNHYRVNILFEDDLLKGLTTGPNTLNYARDVEENLKLVLTPHGLGFQKMKEGSYVIVAEKQVQKIEKANKAALIPRRDVKEESEVPNSILQARTISGHVKDEDGNPLPGVNVIEKGTTKGTITDAEGNFSIAVSEESSALIFSFIGYISEEISIGSRSFIEISLIPDITEMGEVVVIGYGTKEKRDITGSVASIQSEVIAQTTALSPQSAMQGRMPGVLVTDVGGDPSARPEVFIRGVSTFGNNTQPLYIIDGVPVAEFGEGTTYVVEGDRADELRGSQNIFNLINPNDIESISVLKDASAAAIYGVRAANGVVLITTKRGKEGKPRITFSASKGVLNVRKKLDLLNTQQYTQVYREMIENDEFLDPEEEDWIAYFDQNDPLYLGDSPTYDWQDEMINKNGVIENTSVGISGGTEFANYAVSAGYSKQEGALKYVSQKVYSFAANSDYKIAKWLEVGETFRLAYSNGLDNRSLGGVTIDLASALSSPPWQPLFDPESPDGLAEVSLDRWGPEAGSNYVAMTRYNNVSYDVVRTIGSGYATLIPLPGLRIKGTLSIDRTTNDKTQWAKNAQIARFKTDVSADQGNRFSLQNTVNMGFTRELQVNYNRNFGNHNLDILLNASTQEVTFNAINNGVENIPLEDPDIYTISAGDPETITSLQFDEGFALQGYVGRISYKYKDKYYIDGTLMRNGSSRFAPNRRWGTFPAVSAAWRLSSEEFLNNVSFITDFKIRGGWGQLGNQDTRAFAFLATVNRNPQYSLGESDNPSAGAGNPNIAAFIGDFANEELTWEVVTTSNIGFDAAFFDNKISLTAEYYNRKTEDILQNIPFPLTAGLGTPPVFNIADVRNSGIEVVLNYNGSVGDFQYNIGGNITTVKNEVLALSDGLTIYNGERRIIVGQPINSIYGYKTDGIFQTEQEVEEWLELYDSPGNTTQLSPGDYRFLDLYSGPDQEGEPDGIVDGFDQVYLGKTIPGYYYGINLGATFKNFDLNVLFQGVGDVDRINPVKRTGESMTGRGNNWLTTTLNHWTPENTDTDVPRPVFSDPSGNNRFSDRWVESGAFLRLNNVQLGYTLPSSISDNIGINNFRIYVQSTNTFVITNYSGLDPQNDYNPTPRGLLLGINVGF